MTQFLSKEHTILEKGCMEFRPFGVDEHGEKIRDISGVVVRSNVEHLEEYVSQTKGTEEGARAAEELCRLLNERIRDPIYHVTPSFLRNLWNAYSYEFVCFVREFAEQLSGDPQFQFHVGRKKNVPQVIAILGRPFTLPQIYSMWPRFVQKYENGCLECSIGEVTDRSAVLRLKFTDKAYRQFGPYRKACAELVCETCKGGLSIVPERVHRLPPAEVKDVKCIVRGDDCCEWKFTWAPQLKLKWPVWGLLAGCVGFVVLKLAYPVVPIPAALVIALLPPLISWLATRQSLEKQTNVLQDLVLEQERVVDARHEELREAYLEQTRTTVELRRKVSQLTTLHRAGLLFSSILDRETLLHNVLGTIACDLHYDLAMIAFYDPQAKCMHDMRIWGVPEDIAKFVRSQKVPVTDPSSIEGIVLKQGHPVLVNDIRDVWESLHPFYQELALKVNAKAFISVPLKIKDVVIGSLTVDRSPDQALTEDDRDLLVTVANQVAIALDNTEAYRQIEALNLGLEARVIERTAELQAANERLKQMDELKSQFLAHVSHELRTPLTTITGFTDNLLERLAGPLSERQEQYLTRMKANASRLARMITDLLDRSRIEAGKLELWPEGINLVSLVSEVVDQLRPLASAKNQRLQVESRLASVTVWADHDRLNQILTNLIDNAIKYTPDHGGIVVWIEMENSHYARVSIIDSGLGIAADVLPKLFNPFFRARHHERGPTKGLGLGLSIVKDLVELHGGRIRVESQVGKGAQFHFTIPIRRGLQKQEATSSAGVKRILVVDDDPDILQLVKDRLTSEGYSVDTANDGREGLQTLDRYSFDGLILDIGMPHVDGLQVLHAIREKYASMPIIMITAVAARERALLAIEAGAQAYLLKPFDWVQMQRVVNFWFRPHGPHTDEAPKS